MWGTGYWCRHCLEPIQEDTWSVPGSSYWRHVEPRSGLLGSTQCWPTPEAEPMLP